MKTIVVGGNSKDIGKTSVVAGIIANFPELSWSAVKISQDKHLFFEIREEEDQTGAGDTCRFLRAGAKRSLWIGTKPEMLPKAMPLLQQMIANDPCVIIESNSIIRFIKPDLYLMVLDYSTDDFKESAKQYFDLADAYIFIEPGVGIPLWQEVFFNSLTEKNIFKNIFKVAPGKYITPEILNFVRQTLTG